MVVGLSAGSKITHSHFTGDVKIRTSAKAPESHTGVTSPRRHMRQHRVVQATSASTFLPDIGLRRCPLFTATIRQLYGNYTESSLGYLIMRVIFCAQNQVMLNQTMGCGCPLPCHGRGPADSMLAGGSVIHSNYMGDVEIWLWAKAPESNAGVTGSTRRMRRCRLAQLTGTSTFLPDLDRNAGLLPHWLAMVSSLYGSYMATMRQLYEK